LAVVRVELGHGHLLSRCQMDRVHRLELSPSLRDALPHERPRLVSDEIVELDCLDRCPRRPESIDRVFGFLIEGASVTLALDEGDLDTADRRGDQLNLTGSCLPKQLIE